jgi:hypothetical protein
VGNYLHHIIPITTLLLNGDEGFRTAKRYIRMNNANSANVDKIIATANENIKKLDECFSKAPVTTNDGIVLYRGMREKLDVEIGSSVLLKNYTSTTHDLNVALQFTFNFTGPPGQVYRLNIGKDVPFIDMLNFSHVGPKEKEILLPRNLIMIYMGDVEIDIDGSKYTVCDVNITKLFISNINMGDEDNMQSTNVGGTRTRRKRRSRNTRRLR